MSFFLGGWIYLLLTNPQNRAILTVAFFFNHMAPRKPNSKNSITQSGRVIYLNNKELLAEVRASKVAGEMSNTLARMLQLLCSNYARKGQFVGYSYNDDMQAYAMMMLVRTWRGFDPEKGTNPFAWYTQCIKNSFRQYLKYERKHRDVRDLLMAREGLTPSFTYTDSESRHCVDDEQDFDMIKHEAESLKTAASHIVRDDHGMEVELTIDEDCDIQDDVLEIEVGSDDEGLF